MNLKLILSMNKCCAFWSVDR